MNKVKLISYLLLILTCVMASAFADNIVIFGDSLSDAGYQTGISKNIKGMEWPKIPPDYINDKAPTYSSVEPYNQSTVWPIFSFDATPNTYNTPPENINGAVQSPPLYGSDYAAGGAVTTCTGIGTTIVDGKGILYNPPPVGPLRPDSEPCRDTDIDKYNQIGNYLALHNNQANKYTKYIIWAGANNIFKDPSIISAQNAAKDIAYDVKYLREHGASPKNIFVINMPSLGITPLAISIKKVDKFNALSAVFNTTLVSLAKEDDFRIIDVDNDVFKKIVKDNKITIDGKLYAFSNVIDGACATGPKEPNELTCIPNKPNVQKYLFEGNVHPTAYTQYILGKFIKGKIYD